MDAAQEKCFLEMVAINKSGALKSGLAWRYKFGRASPSVVKEVLGAVTLTEKQEGEQI